MKSKLKKLLYSLSLCTGIMTLSANQANAYGENGCIRNPDNIVGICCQNTEGIWKCVVGLEMDCTSSD